MNTAGNTVNEIAPRAAHRAHQVMVAGEPRKLRRGVLAATIAVKPTSYLG